MITTTPPDRRRLRQHQATPLDRVREDQAEDAALLLPRGARSRGRDRRRRDHERPVDGADLAAHPTGDRAVVGAAEEVGHTVGHVQLADAVADRREERADHQDHRDHAHRREHRGEQPQLQRDGEDGAAHREPSSR
jgi:hypothetical protein